MPKALSSHIVSALAGASMAFAVTTAKAQSAVIAPHAIPEDMFEMAAESYCTANVAPAKFDDCVTRLPKVTAAMEYIEGACAIDGDTMRAAQAKDDTRAVMALVSANAECIDAFGRANGRAIAKAATARATTLRGFVASTLAAR